MWRHLLHVTCTRKMTSLHNNNNNNSVHSHLFGEVVGSCLSACCRLLITAFTRCRFCTQLHLICFLSRSVTIRPRWNLLFSLTNWLITTKPMIDFHHFRGASPHITVLYFSSISPRSLVPSPCCLLHFVFWHLDGSRTRGVSCLILCL